MLQYNEPNAVINVIDCAKHRSRAHDAVIRVYDTAGNVIETHEHTIQGVESGALRSIHFDVPATPKASPNESR